MRRRLEELLNGKFEYEQMPLTLTPDKLEAEAGAEDLLTGAFQVSTSDTKKVKGFLYSSNPRVTFEPQQFYANSARIVFQADLTGLRPGESAEGAFTLCTDRGEYSLPYTFKVRTENNTLRKEEAVSTEELAEMARKDPSAAAALFGKASFSQALRENDRDHYLIYQAVRNREDPMQGLEEYLIAVGRKEPVELTLAESSLQLKAPERSEKRQAKITCSGWGYLNISLSSDARFLRLEKKQITTRDFVGGVYPLEYIIDTNFLHAGRNYGRIVITTCYQTLFLEIEVKARGVSSQENPLRIRRLMRRKMLTLYLDFRLKRIDMSSWTERSISVLAGYKRAGGKDIFADLFLVQMYFAGGKQVKGKRLLEEIETQPERFRTREQYAYYLYISTFFERDAAYVDQVESKIEQMFLSRRESWIIQWILLYLQERYLKDDAAKLDAIVMQIQYGCCSPIMYLEAALLYRKNPYLLRALGILEQKILLFAAREHMLTEELAFRIGTLSLASPSYGHKLMRILEACYEIAPSVEVLGGICACLIAGDKKDPAFFRWYALGVDRDVRITGLYEYYMETMDTVGIEKMPQIIRMYFSYNTALNYHKKAAIYRDISDNRDSVPQVYQSSKPGIERFVIEQLSMGRIDRNLAILYERFLTRRALSRNLAEKLVRVLFTFEISCMNPNMNSVIVAHDSVKKTREAPLTSGKTNVRIYLQDSRIFLADERGARYASSSLYMAERFLESPMLLSYCREIIPEHPGLVMYITSSEKQITKDNLSFFKRAAEMEEYTDAARTAFRRMILAWYAGERRSEDLYDYLSSIRQEEYFNADRRTFMQLLTREGMYEQAFSLICTYGCEQIDTACLVRICSQNVLAMEYEEDRQLLEYCYKCFQFGKYDDNVLTYLLMYYDGPIEEMKRLWNTGVLNELDTLVLEEKILSLLIFTRTGSAGTERIFASYQSHLGRKKICMAYLNLKSWEYFVKNLPVSDLIFLHLEELCSQETAIEDIGKLALLQYYSGLPSLTPERTKIAKTLLEEYQKRGMRFAFYQRFPAALTEGMQLSERVFLEYVANPEHTVLLYYRMKGQEEEWSKEPLRNLFEGIFVREFLLFDGEILECYLEEYEADRLVKRSDMRRLHCASFGKGATRFAMINKMSRALAQGEEDRCLREMENYYQIDYLTRELFTLV